MSNVNELEREQAGQKEIVIDSGVSRTIINENEIEAGTKTIIAIKDDSTLNYCDMSETGDVEFIVGNDSTLKYYSFATKAKKDIFVKLAGKGARSYISSMYYISGSEFELHAVTQHAASHTDSLLEVNGIVDGGKSTVRGMIRIDEDADESNGYEKSNALVIKDGEVISVPDLEIHNNNVKCSHGSTITRIDPEKMYYMQSRGISVEDCRQIMIAGFYGRIIGQITDDDIKRKITTEINKVLGNGKDRN